MNRLDRAMGILLLLRGGRVVSATDLAERFEVSIRTVYRDIEVLSGLGIPVVPEMGRRGGFRLSEGYFLPPVTLGTEEAVSLLLGLILMRRLRVMPFPREADFAERKLLAALPEETRRMMERASRLIGFERVPADLLHPERDDPLAPGAAGGRGGDANELETRVVGRFLEAILSRSRVRLSYSSPYRPGPESREVEPRGIVWDRDRWYLVGDVEERPGEARMWRSDRVLEIGAAPSMHPPRDAFDVEEILDRRWLGKAMERWRGDCPVRIALSQAQSALLRADWYYGHASFEDLPEGRVSMSWGESSPDIVAALVRWLGPGAEILEPEAWRARLAADLEAMLAAHSV